MTDAAIEYVEECPMWDYPNYYWDFAEWETGHVPRAIGDFRCNGPFVFTSPLDGLVMETYFPNQPLPQFDYVCTLTT